MPSIKHTVHGAFSDMLPAKRMTCTTLCDCLEAAPLCIKDHADGAFAAALEVEFASQFDVSCRHCPLLSSWQRLSTILHRSANSKNVLAQVQSTVEEPAHRLMGHQSLALASCQSEQQP